jgi:hypothetical protein
MRVSALGQTLTAQFDVQNDSLRIEVRLLGILSSLLSKTQDRLIDSVKSSLRIERAPPKS